MDLHARTSDLHLLREGELGHAEQLREHRRHHAGAAVVGLGGADHEVGLLLHDRGGERLCREQRIRAREGSIRDEHAAISPHRKALADRVLGPLRSHRDQDHLAAVRFLELEAFFDPALIARAEDCFLLAGNCVVRFEHEVRIGIWHLLDGDDDLQGVWTNYRCAESAAWKRSTSAGVLRLSNCATSRPSSHVTSRFSTTSWATKLPASRAPTIAGNALFL